MVNTWNRWPWFIESKTPQIWDKIWGVDDILSNNQIYLPEALELISKFGGKAASLLWQVKKWNGKYILPLSIIVLQSIPVDNLQADISSIIAQWVSEEAKRYAHWFDNNIEYEWISSVILTQECTWRMWSIGSIIEHPNLWWHYVIDFLDGNYEILADASWKIIKSHTSKVDYRGNVKEYPLHLMIWSRRYLKWN